MDRRPSLPVFLNVMIDAQHHARFWSLVDKREPDECWLWSGERSATYGRFNATSTHTSARAFQAHRVALALTLGRDIRNGMLVLHSCGKPYCCNPKHLREGTERESSHDMVTRGRHVPGAGPKRAAEQARIRRHAEWQRRHDRAERRAMRSGKVQP